MRNLILLAFISLFMVACVSTGEQKLDKNIDLVKNYIKSVENLDYVSMGKILDDNYLGFGPSIGDSIMKNEVIESWKWNVSNIYEKIEYKRSRFASVIIPDGENKGEWVANWAELEIVYKDKIGTVTIWANTNYLVENNKILRSITFYNEADVLRQLGYQIVPPGSFVY